MTDTAHILQHALHCAGFDPIHVKRIKKPKIVPAQIFGLRPRQSDYVFVFKGRGIKQAELS